MNLIDLINKYKSEISDKVFLVEYDLFFDEDMKEYCKFALDDGIELEKLNDIILQIKNIDKNSEIYVSTYGLDYIDKKLFIYADTLWINTEIDLDEILAIFKGSMEVEPCDISLLIEDEYMDGIAETVISLYDKVEDYKSFIKNRQLDKIKTLYWD